MNSSLSQELLSEHNRYSQGGAESLLNCGLSSDQFRMLSKLSENELHSLVVVAVHNEGLKLPSGIDIKSPDSTDFTRTQTILNSIGATMGAICGALSIIFGVFAAIAGAVAALSAPAVPISASAAVLAFLFAILAAVFSAAALGIGALIGFLSWLLLPELHSGIEFGGKGGVAFKDELDKTKADAWVFKNYPDSQSCDWEVDSIDLWVGNVVDAIKTRWRGKAGSNVANLKVEGKKFGGDGGQKKTFQLEPNEYIESIKVKAGIRVDSLCFQTNRRVSEIYGGSGGNREAKLYGPVVGLLGRAGAVIDAIGVQTALNTHQVLAFGGNGGIPFFYDLSEMKRLIRINVWHGVFVDAIELCWEDKDGKIVQGPMYGRYFIGGGGGTLKTFELSSDEALTKIELWTDAFVDRVAFHTNKGRSETFGGQGGFKRPAIDLNGRKLLGMVGRYSRYVDQLGVILE